MNEKPKVLMNSNSKVTATCRINNETMLCPFIYFYYYNLGKQKSQGRKPKQ